MIGSSAATFIDPNNLEDLKIPRCADQFVRLLDAIRERYCNLPQPGHQLQFLNLQLELIENFRRRLHQMHNNNQINAVPTTLVLNAINYVNSVLREWGENVVRKQDKWISKQFSISKNKIDLFILNSIIYTFMLLSLGHTQRK